MREPPWSKILRLLYTDESSYALPLDGDANVNLMGHEELSIRHELELSDEEIAASAEFLHEQDLIEMDHFSEGYIGKDPTQNEISLTPDGFEVAHERELKRGETFRNYLIGIFTILLGTGAITQAGVAIYAPLNNGEQAVFGFSAIALLVIGIGALYWAMGGQNPRNR